MVLTSEMLQYVFQVVYVRVVDYCVEKRRSIQKQRIGRRPWQKGAINRRSEEWTLNMSGR